MSMPMSAAASMTVFPLVVLTSLPSIVSLIGSIKTRRLLCWSGGVWSVVKPINPVLQYYRAPLLHDVRLKLFAILFNKCRRRHRRGVAKGTNGVAHNVAADVENQIEIVLLSLTLLNAVKDLFHPVASFAARAALPAGLVGEKPGEVPRGANHAGGIVHHDDPARAEKTTCGLNGFIIEIYFFEFVRAQNRHRPTARDDALEFPTVGDAAAVFLKEFHQWITHFHFIDAGVTNVTADTK